jgi:hypothetical protein
MKTVTDITALHLAKMLDEIEGQFDNDPSQLSYEILEDYINAAGHMAKEFGRQHNRIDAVLEYLQITY